MTALRSVLLLAPANVIHTQRWVEALHERGLQVALASQHDPGDWRAPSGVQLIRLPHSGATGYFLNALALRRWLGRLEPELLNAHYASGYGTTAALCGFKPLFLSVWGSDVYDFPAQSAIKGWLLRRNLGAASVIGSTSQAMALQVRRFAKEKPIAVTPFGVDLGRFKPAVGTPHHPAIDRGLVVGCVKKLEHKYGIDTLINAFAELLRRPGTATLPPLVLQIVGDGTQRDALASLAARLGLAAQVRFVGAVPHAEVPRWLQRFDIYVAPSRLDSESFGVAVIEASACGLPVVVSDAGGLPEVVADGVTGFVVPRENPSALAAALRRLIDSAALRQRLGAAGRQRVLERYEWRACVDTMLAAFDSARVPGRSR